jgi:hypothetical protein
LFFSIFFIFSGHAVKIIKEINLSSWNCMKKNRYDNLILDLNTVLFQ